MGEFKSLFKDACVPVASAKGDWGGSVNGDTSSGQGAMPKGVAGIMPEVTMPDIQGAPGPNDQVGLSGIDSPKSTRAGLSPGK